MHFTVCHGAPKTIQRLHPILNNSCVASVTNPSQIYRGKIMDGNHLGFFRLCVCVCGGGWNLKIRNTPEICTNGCFLKKQFQRGGNLTDQPNLTTYRNFNGFAIGQVWKINPTYLCIPLEGNTTIFFFCLSICLCIMSMMKMDIWS